MCEMTTPIAPLMYRWTEFPSLQVEHSSPYSQVSLNLGFIDILNAEC